MGSVTWRAYIDGSYSEDCPEAIGIGILLLDPAGNVRVDGGKWYTRKSLAALKNVGAEIAAAWIAMNAAKKYGAQKLVVVHDYMGVKNWADEIWQARTEATCLYRDAVALFRSSGLNITFKQVQGHSGNTGNERADYHAKQAIQYYVAKIRQGGK